MDLSTVELFAGVAMLGEGLRAGLEYMGIQTRPVCYVEREAHAAGVLVARMEEGSLDAAPVWSDVTTFPGRLFRGKVDGIVAGFPCQDISVAGQRKGLDGHRSGLFFELPRITDDCGAWFMFLENVAGISSATSTVMDEEEGELFERAAARVVGELADLGWNAEWINVSASDVGANHGRERWFCFAWRDVADTESRGRGQRVRDELARRAEAESAGEQPDHSDGDGDRTHV
jgi:DNA (cytosine-5)-methyltransferase 1